MKFIQTFKQLPTRKQVIVLGLFVVALIGIAAQLIRLSEQPSAEVASPAPLLEGQAYIDTRDFYIEIINSSGPRVALDALRQEMTTNEPLLNNCHPLVHELGREAYESYGYTRAIAELDDVCNSGYIHGVIEQHFSSLEDISGEINSLCSDFDAKSFMGWQCNHGLGHGIMYYTINDLPESLAVCATLQEKEAKDACSNGVFMENFIVGDEYHSSEYTSDEDMLYPCEESYVQSDAKANCYLYAPTYYLSAELGTIETALDNCRTNAEFESVCVRGVGGALMKANLSQPLAVIDACRQSGVRITSCYSGALGLMVFHYGGLEELSTLCNELDDQAYDACVETKIAYTDYF